MAKQSTKQPQRAVVKPSAVFQSQSDGYVNPNAKACAAAVGRMAKGSPSAAKWAASGKGVFESQILRGK
jgi:hypothetical protein